ncbi:hypothetical protein ACRALDRAFT_1081404 [Sodiomyces alcalophilus JCM 7366]|uniref:uncharacterized protein n=1 Tax=Sodiomyces alcalophilus JCM 7366 TaxID=591952 RepID=UPI0039B546B8
MLKRTTFTTITPLPPDVSRETVIDFFHNHLEMIDLNPLIKERHPIPPPAYAPPDEKHCIWYSLTDEISYLPRISVASSNVTYTCAFHDLPGGLQTHCYAPMGLDIRSRWSVGGTLPGEPREPQELGLGAPKTGLYVREDVDIRCNILMASFVKKTLKKSHHVLVKMLGARAGVASSQCPEPRGRVNRTLPSMTPSRPPRPPSADTHFPVESDSRMVHELGDSSQRNGSRSRNANSRTKDLAHGGASYQQQNRQQQQGNFSFGVHYSQTSPSQPPQMQSKPPRISRLHHYYPSQLSIADHTPSLTPTTASTSSSGNRSEIHSPSDVPSPLRIRHKPNGSAGHGMDLIFDHEPPPPRPRYRPSSGRAGPPRGNIAANTYPDLVKRNLYAPSHETLRSHYHQDESVAELADDRQPPPKRIHELPPQHPAALRPGVAGKVARVQPNGRPCPELER